MNEITIEVEVCANCDKHSWFTMHKQQKYDECYQALHSSLLKEIPNVKIVRNLVPPHFKKIPNKFYCEEIYYDQLNDKVVSMPRVGAFEITIFDKTIFSKIKSSQWPHIPTVVNLIRKIIEDKENGKSIDCYGIYSSQSSSVTSSRSKNRPISPLNQRVRVKTETTLLTTNPSAKAISEINSKMSEKMLIPPTKPKGNAFIRFRPKRAESDAPISTTGAEGLVELKKQRTLPAQNKASSFGNKENSFQKPKSSEPGSRPASRARNIVKPQRNPNKTFLNRHTSLIQTGLNKTADHGLDERRQTLNDTSLNTSNILGDLDDSRTHDPPKAKLEERSKSFSNEVFQINHDQEKRVSIEVEVSLSKRQDSSSNIQIALTNDRAPTNPVSKKDGYYFGISEPSGIELESFDTPQMGTAAMVDLTKTAQFGSNFDKNLSQLFPKSKESPIRNDKSSNRYAVPDLEDEIFKIKKTNVLTDSTITFAGKNMRASQEPENNAQADKGLPPKLQFRSNKTTQSRDSKDFLNESFGKESPHFCNKDSNRKSLQSEKDKLKLNEGIFEYNNPLRMNSISKNPTMPSSRGSKKNSSTTEFSFTNVDPLIQDMAALKMNFIKNSGSLQKRSSASTLENSNSTAGKLLESK